MPILRFPNPVSDIQKFWETYRILYNALSDDENFGHDEMTDVLIEHNLVTSSGAAGVEAVRRSRRDDRSRDPLYNQLKMYSELYRMLGWLHPGRNHTHFVMNEFGEYIGEAQTWNSIKPLVKECVLNIVFPNPHVENRGGHFLRPFPLILQVMSSCDNFILRDELISFILSLPDDRPPTTIQEIEKGIRDVRGDFSGLQTQLQNAVDGLQINTAQNYTRFPLGVLRTSDWATPSRDSVAYNQSLVVYSLTQNGISDAQRLKQLKDIRTDQLNRQGFQNEEKLNFILLSNYSLLERAGYPLGEVSKYINEMESRCRNILIHFDISQRSQIMFSPYQQLRKSEVNEASEYQEANY